jgi:hypothetical protein
MFGLFGPRMTTVFRSKWRALWWAASILVGVYFSIPSERDTQDLDSQKDAEAVAAILGMPQPSEAAKHVDPWAKTPQG